MAKAPNQKLKLLYLWQYLLRESDEAGGLQLFGVRTLGEALKVAMPKQA